MKLAKICRARKPSVSKPKLEHRRIPPGAVSIPDLAVADSPRTNSRAVETSAGKFVL